MARGAAAGAGAGEGAAPGCSAASCRWPPAVHLPKGKHGFACVSKGALQCPGMRRTGCKAFTHALQSLACTVAHKGNQSEGCGNCRLHRGAASAGHGASSLTAAGAASLDASAPLQRLQQ